MLHNRLW